MNAAITKLPAFRRYRLQNNKQTKKEGFLNTAHFDPLADLTTTICAVNIYRRSTLTDLHYIPGH